jgi:hypothetical protein
MTPAHLLAVPDGDRVEDSPMRLVVFERDGLLERCRYRPRAHNGAPLRRVKGSLLEAGRGMLQWGVSGLDQALRHATWVARMFWRHDVGASVHVDFAGDWRAN